MNKIFNDVFFDTFFPQITTPPTVFEIETCNSVAIF